MKDKSEKKLFTLMTPEQAATINGGRRGRGKDDPAGHQRRGRGADDGPNHT